MTKRKLYRYLGRNGILTTPILLDGINHIPMVELRAAKGYILTNDTTALYSVVVEEADVDQWHEIADKKD
jgi:hypothetical protein